MSIVSFAGYDPSERQLRRWSSPAPVKQKADRRRCFPSKLDDRVPEMQALFAQGMDTYEIAKALSLTEVEVYNRLARASAGK